MGPFARVGIDSPNQRNLISELGPYCCAGGGSFLFLGTKNGREELQVGNR